MMEVDGVGPIALPLLDWLAAEFMDRRTIHAAPAVHKKLPVRRERHFVCAVTAG